MALFARDCCSIPIAVGHLGSSLHGGGPGVETGELLRRLLVPQIAIVAAHVPHFFDIHFSSHEGKRDLNRMLNFKVAAERYEAFKCPLEI